MNDAETRQILPSPSVLPVALYRAEQVRQFDRIAIEELGIPAIELMERAGSAAFQVLQQRWPGAKRLVVVCGSGNNGGDGYVVARLAREAGLHVELCTPPDAPTPKGDAKSAREAWLECGGTTASFSDEMLAAPAVIVDGLLGTGLQREVTGVYAEILTVINASGLPVLALDIPSGLSADTGMALGTALRAELTITFVGLKRGLFTGEAPDLVGEVRFADLGIPAEARQRQEPAATRIGDAECRPLLSPRPRSAHKGANGHVLVVGGDVGMSGAARMAAEAAARVGAGLISVATRAEHASWISVGRPEIMSHGVEDATALGRLIERATVLVVGPGLGRGGWGEGMLDACLESGKPLVIDADGLYWLAASTPTPGDWVLTPHPGEAARLLACTVAEIQRDRFAAADALQQRYRGVVLLKGAGTLISDGIGPVGVNTSGNPGMGSGGMGDVLSGVVAGLWAQGLVDGRGAARLGAYLHGLAADHAALDGERGLLASDLFPHLRALVNPPA